MSKLHRLIALGLFGASACEVHHVEAGTSTGPVDDSFDERPVERAAESPPPITGGTLLVTGDGVFAMASDPDRDLVHVVDLTRNEQTAAVALPHRARPFRLAEDGTGLVHVTLRGTGNVVAIDPHAGQIVSTTYACPNPRGLTYHDQHNTTLVACAGGQLVEIAADGSVLGRRFVATDLRDVMVIGGTTFVSRFRGGEVLEVPDVGEVVQDGAPLSPTGSGVRRAPGIAWRTLETPDGGWLMLHQLATTEPLDAPPPGGLDDSGGDTEVFVGDQGGGYTGSSAGPGCGATTPALSTRTGDGDIFTSDPVGGIALAVDVALDPSGTTLTIASPSQHDAFRRSTLQVSLTRFNAAFGQTTPTGDCILPDEPLAVGDFVAVAYAPDGTLLAQTRSDPRLHRFDTDGSESVIDLEGETIVDTGHDLFHLDTGGGIACASCHPEGGDDGRVWAFVDQGPRRTQSLDAGIAGTEPFHWQGDMHDLSMLAHEVRQRRMGGAELTAERIAALQEWLFAIPQPNHERDGSDPLAARGAGLFTELGCRTCHSGPAFTSNGVADFGRGPLQIPNLRGVALRPPYMHDGRCATLSCATKEMIEVNKPGALDHIGVEGLAAVVAYMETL